MKYKIIIRSQQDQTEKKKMQNNLLQKIQMPKKKNYIKNRLETLILEAAPTSIHLIDSKHHLYNLLCSYTWEFFFHLTNDLRKSITWKWDYLLMNKLKSIIKLILGWDLQKEEEEQKQHLRLHWTFRTANKGSRVLGFLNLPWNNLKRSNRWACSPNFMQIFNYKPMGPFWGPRDQHQSFYREG